MHENTYKPEYWTERAKHGGIEKKSCNHLAYLERRAPYNKDMIASWGRRIDIYPETDDKFNDPEIYKQLVGAYPKLPDEKRCKDYYKSWAAKEVAWRKEWTEKDYSKCLTQVDYDKDVKKAWSAIDKDGYVSTQNLNAYFKEGDLDKDGQLDSVELS